MGGKVGKAMVAQERELPLILLAEQILNRKFGGRRKRRLAAITVSLLTDPIVSSSGPLETLISRGRFVGQTPRRTKTLGTPFRGGSADISAEIRRDSRRRRSSDQTGERRRTLPTIP
jgi:hypothetical protein